MRVVDNILNKKNQQKKIRGREYMRNTKKQKVKWHHKSNCAGKNINYKLLTKSVKVQKVNGKQSSTSLSTVDTLDSINNILKSKSKI